LSARLRNLVIGAAIGAAAVLSISFGVPGLVVALLFVLAVAVVRRSLWIIAGAFITTGTIWIILALRTFTGCETSGICGDLNLTPFLVACAVLVLLGLSAGVGAWWLGTREG
jgi:hypothetical protein